MNEALDLRRLPLWDRAAFVLERSDALNTGESLEFLMPIDPRALMSRLEQLRPGRLTFAHRRVAKGEWRVRMQVRSDAQPATLRAALAKCAPFGLLGDDIATIERAALERTVVKGQTVCAENSPCPGLGVVLEGSMGVLVGAGSRECLLFQLFTGDAFGDAEFFDGGLSIGRTTVLSKTARFAQIPFDAVHKMGARHPAFTVALAAGVAQRSRALASMLADHVSLPILARIAGALLKYAAPERGLHPALPPLATMTQSQVAAAAGTVKEVAARTIGELERLGALRRERGHIRYLDRSKLLATIERSQ